eukprot:277193_1
MSSSSVHTLSPFILNDDYIPQILFEDLTNHIINKAKSPVIIPLSCITDNFGTVSELQSDLNDGVDNCTLVGIIKVSTGTTETLKSIYNQIINATHYKQNCEIISIRNNYCNSNSLNNSYSFTQIIQNTCKCLVFGYLSQIIKSYPSNIYEICIQYFIGNFPSLIDDDTLSMFNVYAKTELIQICFDLLCPGNNIQNNQQTQSLKRLIDILSASLKRLIDAEYHSYLYLSILVSLTEICNFYNILSSYKVKVKGQFRKCINYMSSYDDNLNLEYDAKTVPYTQHLFQITKQRFSNRGDKILLHLAYKLLNDNEEWFEIYKSTPGVFHNMLIAQNISNKVITNVQTLRKMLYKEIDSCTNRIGDLSAIEKVMDIIRHDQGTYVNDLGIEKRLTVPAVFWLWLQMEIEYILANNYETLPANLSADIIELIQSGDGKNNEHAADILYLLIEVIQLYKVQYCYQIINFEVFSGFVTSLLASEKYGIIGWEMLNAEMECILRSGKWKHDLIVCGYVKMINKKKYIPLDIIDMCYKFYFHNKKYKFYNEWIQYIDSKMGLFKMNFVSNIRILKNKNIGDLELASKHLLVGTKACYRIHKLLQKELVKFNVFYVKMQKTKLIKPLLRNIIINSNA